MDTWTIHKPCLQVCSLRPSCNYHSLTYIGVLLLIWGFVNWKRYAKKMHCFGKFFVSCAISLLNSLISYAHFSHSFKLPTRDKHPTQQYCFISSKIRLEICKHMPISASNILIACQQVWFTVLHKSLGFIDIDVETQDGVGIDKVMKVWDCAGKG